MNRFEIGHFKETEVLGQNLQIFSFIKHTHIHTHIYIQIQAYTYINIYNI